MPRNNSLVSNLNQLVSNLTFKVRALFYPGGAVSVQLEQLTDKGYQGGLEYHLDHSDVLLFRQEKETFD